MIREGLTFDDVLLVPQHSTVKSRSDVDITVNWGGLRFEHPIIPANMKTVTGKEMALEIIKSGGLAILHRFMFIDKQITIAQSIVNLGATSHFAVSVGVKSNDKEYVEVFYEAGVRIICVDVAHGDSQQCI